MSGQEKALLKINAENFDLKNIIAGNKVELETLRAENKSLKARERFYITHFQEINERCNTEYHLCPNCGEHDSIKNCNSHLAAKKALSISPTGLLEISNLNEAKDALLDSANAQIRVLVEALESIDTLVCLDKALHECSIPKVCLTMQEIATEALATIPAEALELAKLEREVVETNRAAVKARKHFHGVKDMENMKAVKKLEAYKEGRG
jgi:hypothetical protein